MRRNAHYKAGGILFFLLFACFALRSQTTLLIKGGSTGLSTFVVRNGTHVYINGGISIDGTGSPAGSEDDFLRNDGTIRLASGSTGSQSHFTNNVNGLKTYTPGQTSGEVIFESGSTTQSITGSGTVEFMNLRTANASVPQLELYQDVDVAGSLHMGGRVNIRGNNLTLLLSASLDGAPHSAANMIQADGAGRLVRHIAAGVGIYLFPVGDGNAVYSPVTFGITANANAGNLGLNLRSQPHPEIHNPDVAGDFLSRYWTFSNEGLSSYSYTVAFTYVPADVNGEEQALLLSRWDAGWQEYTGSGAAGNLLSSNALLNETTAPFMGDYTGRNALICVLPVADFSYEQDDSDNFMILFSGNSVAGTSYTWDFGNGNTSTEQHPAFGFPFEGIYPVTLIVSNDCGSDTITLNVNVEKRASVEDMAGVDVSIYPNPSADVFFVKIRQRTMEKLNLEIYDLPGRVVYSAPSGMTGEQIVKVDARHLSPGVYALQLRGTGGRLSRKLIVSK